MLTLLPWSWGRKHGCQGDSDKRTWIGRMALMIGWESELPVFWRGWERGYAIRGANRRKPEDGLDRDGLDREDGLDSGGWS